MVVNVGTNFTKNTKQVEVSMNLRKHADDPFTDVVTSLFTLDFTLSTLAPLFWYADLGIVFWWRSNIPRRLVLMVGAGAALHGASLTAPRSNRSLLTQPSYETLLLH